MSIIIMSLHHPDLNSPFSYRNEHPFLHFSLNFQKKLSFKSNHSNLLPISIVEYVSYQN